MEAYAEGFKCGTKTFTQRILYIKDIVRLLIRVSGNTESALSQHRVRIVLSLLLTISIRDLLYFVL